jgi:hypothetical protein
MEILIGGVVQELEAWALVLPKNARCIGMPAKDRRLI